ncbi:tripartite tricarboxylate transporter TctB family protein [Oceanobacillus oncorhynchi subsp. oncorhynchi]|uniref:tripartite tricarboxylate transporter TctB family protein n=1 Tax=Oceanobacillus TaxID=182709 RepID=UPI0030D79D84
MLKTMNQRLSVILLIIAVGYLVLTYQLPSYGYTQVDADVIPSVLGWVLIALAIGLFFTKDSETEEQKKKRVIPKKEVLILILVAVFLFVYIMFLEMLGFILMTAIFIFFCSRFLGYKKHITNVIVSIVFPIFMYFVFTEFLRISLPQGILPF